LVKIKILLSGPTEYYSPHKITPKSTPFSINPTNFCIQIICNLVYFNKRPVIGLFEIDVKEVDNEKKEKVI
jgi:hypothetical protein